MKTVLITGSSSGIGEATAKLFSANGWNVAATMRNANKFDVFKGIKNISCYLLDTTNPKSIETCIAQVVNDYGTIDAVVNNAGVYDTAPLELASDETIDRLIQTNIRGTIRVIRAIMPHFRSNGAGIIINVLSIAGRVTFPYQTVYHTTKWAIEGMSEGLRYELKPLNIQVKVVEPGMVKTNLYDSILKRSFEDYPAQYKSDFKRWYNYLIGNYRKGYDPVLDAKTIYKAAICGGNKLRFPSDLSTKFVLLLRSMLPLSLFQFVVSKQIK